ncbi:glycosyltransferase (plasmid) [Pseudochrobactrum algeriensis]|uniref:glycosyltransferase n=1 Tax=Pseudochrobactrum algeriensis TaxID=2834768 RepID=UPI001BCB700E|nr:glycosyltransferase [Pseudochrobactrum algeriensis]QVQ38603.1 glycosyltransferase [Pseudochrobactrum algeriensis]QVQ38722.1 glycosyltransferase [Pseudochrobactrum algeriensis]QVQ42265.1 glycosyltransferase [Pseudochrobactrum algeriensis]
MRILLVTPEVPRIGGGGIATYSANMMKALSESGHTVNVLSWSVVSNEKTSKEVTSDAMHVNVSVSEVWAKYNAGPQSIAVSHFLLDYILEAISLFESDVLEGTDYLAPLYAYQIAKRNGTLASGLSKPVVIYNHGLQRDIYRCDANIPTEWDRQNIYSERLTLKWADLVINPSNFSYNTLVRQCGNILTSKVIPEPYYFNNKSDFEGIRNNYISLGRTCISKGLDKNIHFLNVIDSINPIDEILFIGKVGYTPFKVSSADDYTLKRLKPSLRGKINITGHLSRDEVAAAINRESEKGYSLNFSPQETFNYAFLELLDNGWLPYSMMNSAMEEFFPKDLQHLLIPEDFNLSTLGAIYEAIQCNHVYGNQIREYAEALTHPDKFSDDYLKAVDPLISSGKTFPAAPRATARASDVTFLMATFNPKEQLLETVSSIKAQTEKGARMLVMSDGSYDAQSLALLDQLNAFDHVRVIHSVANEGLCATRTKLIASCETKLSIFIDDDDLIEDRYLEKTLNVYNKNIIGANAVLTWRRNFGINNHLIINFNMDDYEFFLWNDFRMTSLIDTASLRNVGFIPGMRNGEADDWDFWLRFKEMGYVATILPEDLFRYRYQEGSMSWPWSKGQAELTAELQYKRIIAGLKIGRVADDIVLEMLTSARLTEMEIAPNHSVMEQSDLAAIQRWKFISNAKLQRPVIGRISEFLYRGGSWLARKSTGQSVKH